MQNKILTEEEQLKENTDRYEDFLAAYMHKHDLPREIAETHITVRIYKDFYMGGQYR